MRLPSDRTPPPFAVPGGRGLRWLGKREWANRIYAATAALKFLAHLEDAVTP